MKSLQFPLLWIFTTSILLFSCGFAEEMTKTPADSPEGRQKAYVIHLDDTEASVARKVWSQYIRDHKSRVQRIKRSSVEMAKSVDIAGLAGDVSIKSDFKDQNEATEMQLWFVRENEYLTPDKDKASFEVIDRFIDQYFSTLEAAQIQLEVDNEEEKLKKMERELDNLRKQNDQLHREISKAEDRIKESRIKIEENLREQDQRNQEILEQKRIVEQTKNQTRQI